MSEGCVWCACVQVDLTGSQQDAVCFVGVCEAQAGDRQRAEDTIFVTQSVKQFPFVSAVDL